MSNNRRRHANAIPIASFLTWAFVGIIACGGGLGYVWTKNQLYNTGTEIKALERELAELRNKNEVAVSKISQLASTAKLQERFNSGFINLVPITNDKAVLIENSPAGEARTEIRAVSNKGANE